MSIYQTISYFELKVIYTRTPDMSNVLRWIFAPYGFTSKTPLAVVLPWCPVKCRWKRWGHSKMPCYFYLFLMFKNFWCKLSIKQRFNWLMCKIKGFLVALCDNWFVGWVAVTQVLGRMILSPKWQRCFKRSHTAGPTISLVAVNSCSNMGDRINQWWVGRSSIYDLCFWMFLHCNSNLERPVGRRRRTANRSTGTSRPKPCHMADDGQGTGWLSRASTKPWPGLWCRGMRLHCGPKNIHYRRILVIILYYNICSHTRAYAYTLIYIYIYIYMFACVILYVACTNIYIYIYTYLYAYITRIYMCVSVCVRACIGSARPGMPAQKTCL